jgi:putative acetyltransferase
MIRKTSEKDLEDILDIHQLAFGEVDESEMVQNLLNDETAEPTLSLLAFQDDEPVGHILFSKATLSGSDISCALLAPLAVLPEVQFKGHGKRLMKEGFRQLKEMGIDLIFVLGDPEYYQRAGFLMDAGALGFVPPHPIPLAHRDAWMVRALDEGIIGAVSGKVRVADAINAPDFWGD